MKLLGIEAKQNATYYLGRHEQVRDFGADLYVLNGVGEPDFWPADKYRIVGSQHIDDIVAAARDWHAEHQFDGVYTMAEASVVAAATIAEALGLPTVGVEAARNSRNKLLMRQCHERAGVPRPRFRYVPELQTALDAAEEFGYPVVIKPTLGAASHFVYRVDNPAEMVEKYAAATDGLGRMIWMETEAKGLDLGPYGLILESFLDGREYLFEALVWDDDVYLGSIVDRVTMEGDNFDDDVHVAPTSLTKEQLEEIHGVVAAAAYSQGLRRSVMHAEIRFHEGRAHMLEIAIRPGGGGLDMVARVTADYCPIRAVMDVARGVKPRVRQYTPTGVHMMGTCVISEGGQVEYVAVPDEVRDSPQTLMAKITARPGDIIRRPPEGNNILGFLIITGTSYDDVKHTLESYADQIRVKMVGKPEGGCITPWSRDTPRVPA